MRQTSARRPGALLLAALLLLAAMLGAQAAGAPTASAATGPTAVDDVGEVSVSSGGRLPYAANDLPGSAPLRLDRSGFPADQLASLPAGSSISSNGSTLAFGKGGPGLVMRSDGTIEVHPLQTGRWTARYRIVDSNGATAQASFTVVVTAGGIGNDVETVQGRPVTVDVLADDRPGRNADGTLGSIDRGSLRFPTQQTLPVTVSADGLTLTDPGVGVFSSDPLQGLLTFTPDLTYVGNSGSIVYSARDTTRAADGGVLHHGYTATIQWGVQAVVRLVVSQSVSPKHFDHVGQVLTWTAKIANVGPSALTNLTLSESTKRLSARTCTPVSVGGTLARGQSTVCTATSTVLQQDFDGLGFGQQDSITATATTVQDGHALTTTATNGTFAAADVHQGLSLTSSSTPSTVSQIGQRVDYTFVARNRGNVSLRDLVVSSSSAGVSALICSPVPLGGTLGDGQSTTCRASRTVTAANLATSALTATAKATAAPVLDDHSTASNAVTTNKTPVTVSGPGAPAPGPTTAAPVATADSASTTVGQPVVVDVLTNDRPGSPDVPLVGSGVRLRTNAPLPAGSSLYGDAKTLKVAGRGVFLVSGTGQITFVPLGRATGPVPVVGYQVADANGATARTTLTVTVR